MKKFQFVKGGLVAIAALLCASCEIYPGGYSSSVAWTAASYDANGMKS